VVGVVPRVPDDLVPERHLGLVTPAEYQPGGEFSRRIRELAARIDLDRILTLAKAAPAVESALEAEEMPVASGAPVRIGYIRDSAFTFYYPENLEALERAGATLAPVSALADRRLPEIDALYIGGGFPETHAAALAANATFLADLRSAASNGMPIYAECGGLMLLSRAIQWNGARFPMAGVLPFDVDVCPTPQGHGYADLLVDRPNPFFPVSTRLKGHEFHYSRIVEGAEPPPAVCAVERGCGCYKKRDGIVIGNVWVSYTHLHGGATPEWAIGLVSAARRFARECVAV
jgi:cobyrinic acid a,c-diamide synthase